MAALDVRCTVMRSMSFGLFKVVVDAASLNGVVPCVAGEVEVDVTVVISVTNSGASKVTPCAGSVPRVDDDVKDVYWGDGITQIAGVFDQDGGILSAWRVWVPVESRITYCRCFHRG